MIKALVLGELCEDILLHNPAGVEVMGQKTWVKDIVLSAGGSTYYTGAALLHLGADVKISSVLGTDEAGDRVYNQMMLDGLNICHTERLPGRKTTKSMMVCDGGDKQFIGCTPMLPLKIPEWLALKGSDLFYIAGYTLYPELWEEEMVNLCCKAKRHGVCIAMDSQLLPIVGDNLAQISKLDQILPYVDIFFTAKKEADRLYGTRDLKECYARMEAMGFRGQLVLKSGSEGCQVKDLTGEIQEPAFPVKAYDTVGSGDVFGAAYCWARCNGGETRYCARFAAACTALSIQEYAERKHFPSAAEAEAFLLTKNL